MIVRRAADLNGSEVDVHGPGWSSLRLLVAGDRMGFTITDVVLEPGMDQVLWYKNHLEACYCLEGEAELEDLSTGTTHEIEPGTLYALDQHDRHRLRSRTRARLICVFTPALEGSEIHDEDGSYGAPGSK